MKTTTFFGLFAMTGVLLSAKTTAAQTMPSVRTPVADNTLGTQVSANNNNYTVTGGLSRGQTLFHSFSDFSIPTGGAANFSNPTGTRDIISRVTGGSFSDIDGVLNSGGANFLLINPNGVVFGRNTQLNVGKAFAASTANGVDLFDAQGKQYTFGTNGAGDAPLLTINPNVFLNISRLNMGANRSGSSGIINYGTLQTNNDSQYIGLIGGNVTLDGRYGGGKIVAPGGRVDIGGLNTVGTVSLDRNGLTFGGNGLIFSDVLLTNGANIFVMANQPLATITSFINNATSPGSSINISANNVRMINDNSPTNTNQVYLQAGLNSGSGVNNTGTTGDININATGDVSLDRAKIFNTVEAGAIGNIGDINVNAKSLSLNNGSKIVSAIQEGATGTIGDIRIATQGDITISGVKNTNDLSDKTESSQIINSLFGTGTAGKVILKTQGDVVLSNNGSIINSIHQKGVANQNNRQGITIDAKNLRLENRSAIEASNYGGTGDASNVNINLKGDLTIVGTTNPAAFNNDTAKNSTSGITSAMSGVGNSGNINIKARNIRLENFSIIQTNNYSKNKGNAGDIKIETTGDLTVSGTNLPALSVGNIALSSIASANAGVGKVGKITIDTKGTLSLVNRGAIYNSIDDTGNAEGQDLNIKADRLNLTNHATISAANFGGIGKTGNINISSNRGVELDRNSSISNSNFGQGEAGNINIKSDRLDLNNNSKIDSVAERATGGNINLVTRDRLLLKNNSNISTDANSFGNNDNGGNIRINSPLIIAAPGNNNITANAFQGAGGRVDVVSEGLFGIAKRDRGSEFTNDITATSGFAQNGIVDIKTPGTDPGKDSNRLPTVPNDASNQISQVCSLEYRQNKFYVTGRGGIPPNAYDPLTAETIWQDSRGANGSPATAGATNPRPPLPPPAVGWVFDGKGRVTLISAGGGGHSMGTSVLCPNILGR